MKVTDFSERVPPLDVQMVGDFPDVDEADLATAASLH